MLRIGTIVLNVEDARRASQFWSQALGYAYRDGGYSQDTTPVLLPPSATTVAVVLEEDDRTHLDLHTDSALEQQAEIERLVSLGATRVDWAYPGNARFVVLADPEGNLFCVVNTARELLTPAPRDGKARQPVTRLSEGGGQTYPMSPGEG